MHHILVGYTNSKCLDNGVVYIKMNYVISVFGKQFSILNQGQDPG